MANPQYDLPLPDFDDFDMRAIDALPDLGAGMDFVAEISDASALPGLAQGSDSTSATNAVVFNRPAVDPSLWQRPGPPSSSFAGGSQSLSTAVSSASMMAILSKPSE